MLNKYLGCISNCRGLHNLKQVRRAEIIVEPKQGPYKTPKEWHYVTLSGFKILDIETLLQ